MAAASLLGLSRAAAADLAPVALEVRDPGAACVDADRVKTQVALQLDSSPWDAAADDVITIDVVADDPARLPVATLRRAEGAREFTAPSCAVLEANLITALAVALSPSPSPPATPTVVRQLPPAEIAPQGDRSSSDRPIELVWRWPRLLPLGIAVGGATLIGFGYSLEAIATDKMNRYADTLEAACSAGCTPEDIARFPLLTSALRDRDSAQSMGRVAVGVWIVGLATAATGLVMSVLNQPTARERPRVVTAIGPELTGVAIQGQF